MLQKDHIYRTGFYKNAIFKIKAMLEDRVKVFVYESVEMANRNDVRPIDRIDVSGVNYHNTEKEVYAVMKKADPAFVDIGPW